MQFDDLAYDTKDPGNIVNKQNLVQPWDSTKGFRGFGLDETWDVLGKIAFKPNSKLRLSLSYWVVAAHRQGFSPSFLYWDLGQNELFRDNFAFSHS